ncbi:hypothetical protein SAMN05660642_01874 [Geodermatophilus siccatus]|uniref:Uncharacterized protein n=1 Tax=Geodermatophilus siccatus TaxID=1137991 RepID=A0A1G9RF55_9ACTN|nr:hypothetical protein SAMN05660642_01874 [Geodermatophilus siccatus]
MPALTRTKRTRNNRASRVGAPTAAEGCTTSDPVPLSDRAASDR